MLRIFPVFSQIPHWMLLSPGRLYLNEQEINSVRYGSLSLVFGIKDSSHFFMLNFKYEIFSTLSLMPKTVRWTPLAVEKK